MKQAKYFFIRFLFIFLGLLSISLTAVSAQNLTRNTNNQSQILSNISNLSAIFVYNLDDEQLKKTLEVILNTYPQIKALHIRHADDKSTFLIAEKDYNSKIRFNQPISPDSLALPSLTSHIFYNNSVIGELDLYFQEVRTPYQYQDMFPRSQIQAWIDDQPEIKIGLFDWSPLITVPKDKQSQPSGILVDLLKTLLPDTHFRLSFVTGSYADLLQKISNGEIDLIPGLYFQKSLEQYGTFSPSLITVKDYLYVDEENDNLQNLHDLLNHTIGLVAQPFLLEYLSYSLPNTRIKSFQTSGDALAALHRGDIDAILDAHISMSTELAKNETAKVKSFHQASLPTQSLHLFTSHARPELSQYIIQQIDLLSNDQKYQIIQSYTPDLEKRNDNSFSYQQIFLLLTLLFFFTLLAFWGSAEYLKKKKNSDISLFTFGSPIFSKFVIFCLALFITYCATVSWFILSQQYKSIESQHYKNLSLSLKLIEERIAQKIDARTKSLLALRDFQDFRDLVNYSLNVLSSKETDIPPPNWSNYWQIISVLLEGQSYYVMSLDNQRLFGSTHDTENLEVARLYPHLYRDLLAGKTAMIPPIAHFPDNQEHSHYNKIRLLIPILSQRQELQAILVENLELKETFKDILSYHLDSYATNIYPIDNQGYFLTTHIHDAEEHHHHDKQQFIPFQEDINYLNSILNAPEQARLHQYHNHIDLDVLGLVYWSDLFDFGFVAEIPAAAAFQPYQRLKYSLTALILLILFFVMPILLITLNLGRKANKKLQNAQTELEQKVLERTIDLSKAEEQGRLILTSIGQGLFGLDNQGRVIFINDAALNMLGFVEQDIIGKSILDKIIPDQQKNQIQQALLENITFSDLDTVFLTQDKNPFPVEYSCRSILDHHQVRGCVVVFSDIRYRKQMSEALEQAKQDAEQASQTKSAFLANMSHEIRTPMNSIIGMAHLVLETPLSNKQRNYIEKLSQSAHFLLNIINDILDFSKNEAGKLSLEEIPFSLSELMQDIHQLTVTEADKKGLLFTISISEQIPDILLGDPLRLKQILINLTNNAIKFTSQGHVSLNITCLDPDNSDQNTQNIRLLFCIADSGIGINETQLSHLFTSFSQADSSTTRQFGGTGLGLAICKQLAQAMNGDIWVKSTYGKGSQFYVSLPFQEAEDNINLPQYAAEAQRHDLSDYQQHLQKLQGAHILLVEDVDLNQEVARDILETNNILVSLANNGLEAIEHVQQTDFDAILMDCHMPLMDGYQATQEIRKLPKGGDIPILAMTANAMQEDREKSLKAGMNDHIDKPILIPDLFHKLSKWVKAKAPQSSVPVLAGQQISQHQSYPFHLLNDLDVESALRLCQQNSDLYVSLLQKFKKQNDAFLTDLENSDPPMSSTDLKENLHILKSTSGNIGARTLQTVIQSLSDFLDEQSSPQLDLDSSEISVFIIALKQSLSDINHFLAALPEPDIAPSADMSEEGDEHNPQKLSEMIDQMVFYLQGADTEALSLCDKFDLYLRDYPHLETTQKNLKQALSEYDFETAYALFQNISAEIGDKPNEILSS